MVDHRVAAVLRLNGVASSSPRRCVRAARRGTADGPIGSAPTKPRLDETDDPVLDQAAEDALSRALDDGDVDGLVDAAIDVVASTGRTEAVGELAVPARGG